MFPIVEAGSPALEGTSLPAFVVARDGLYLRKRSLLGLSQTKLDRVAHLPAAKAFLDYRLGKLPAELMGRVVGFFAAVYDRQRTEALVLLLWQDDHFEVLVPSQSATSVSVRHKLDSSSMPPGSRIAGTIHSHGDFSAFASATDEDDEADLDGLHVVVGDLLRRAPSFSAAIVVDGHRFGTRPSQVLERPRAIVPPPDEWLARVKVAPAPRPKRSPKAAPFKVLPGKVATVAPSPDRRRLDELLDAAASLAERLGYRLRADLVPAYGTQEGAADA
jgi:proteasome lid subunit RPN8/RPN11